MESSAKTQFIDSLDGVRTICIIFTILHHIKGVPNQIIGSVGVDIFFALSGFLITYLLFQDFVKHQQGVLKSFYIRRFFRIIPLYYLTISLYVIASVLLKKITGGHDTTNDITQALNYYLCLIPEFNQNPATFSHAWTLGIEEKFYLLWPLGMYLIVKYPRFRFWAVVLLMICVGLLTMFAHNAHHAVRGYFGLSAGAALCLYIQYSHTVRDYFIRAPIAIGALAGIAFSYYLIYLTDSYVFNLAVAFFAAFLIASLWHNQQQSVSRFLSSKVIAYPGKLTYSIYLLHVLVINVVVLLLAKLHVSAQWWLVFILVYAASFVIAHFIHHFFEQPLINFGKSLAKKHLSKNHVLSPV